MIVKIFPPSAKFKAVRYNTDKIDKDKGELVKVVNFGALQGLEHLKPSDYLNYLEARSATNSRTKFPQFHAMISCKGKSHSKEELSSIAEQWLKGMGYEDQPYLMVFHKDTENNHIHIVSSRIDANGRKINDSYEKIRAYQVLNKIMGLDQKQQVKQDVAKALTYQFCTRAQFMMILEAQGYELKLSGNEYLVSKFGKQLTRVGLSSVDSRIVGYQKNIDRLAQLRAIIGKYRQTHAPALVPVTISLPGNRAGKTTGYTSALAELLTEKFGVKIIFHGKDGRQPYGYTLIDHMQKIAYKGGDLMPLAELIGLENETRTVNVPKNSIVTNTTDTGNAVPAGLMAPQSECERIAVDQTWQDHGDTSGYKNSWLEEVRLDIAGDIDDEAILGRNRRRKRKARTNTR